RLTNVLSPAGSFTNEYSVGVAGASGYSSHLVRKLCLGNLSVITNDFDPVARLLATHLRNSSGVLTKKHEYQYSFSNQHTATTRRDSSTVAYLYDKIGQLTVADSSVNAEDSIYTYDAAWNLSTRSNYWLGPEAFCYDVKNELTNTHYGNVTYDGNGNLTGMF